MGNSLTYAVRSYHESVRQLLSQKRVEIVMIGSSGLNPKRIIGFLKQKGIYLTAKAGTNNIDEIILYHGSKTQIHIKFLMTALPEGNDRVLDESRTLPSPYRVNDDRDIGIYIEDAQPDAIVWVDALEKDALKNCMNAANLSYVQRSVVLFLLDQAHEQSQIFAGTTDGKAQLAKMRQELKEKRYGAYNHVQTFNAVNGDGLERAVYWLVTAIVAKESVFDYTRQFNQMLESGRAGEVEEKKTEEVVVQVA